MTDKTRQDTVNAAAWAACDTFRGVIDPAQYKDYILTTLFHKYISDVWKDHYEEYKARFGDDEERILRRLERERFVLPPGSSFDEIHAQRNTDNIGERINIALTAIEDANKAKLEGVFRNIDFNSEIALGETRDRNRRLKNLLEDFAKPALDLRPSRVGEDVIGETYIYLISRFASDAGKKAGEFFTPRRISELLVRLARPRPGDRICDPTCGSGSLLIRAAEEVQAAAAREKLPESEARNYALFGQEANGGTQALARMNMFLHGQDGARIEWGDTLNNPKLVEGEALLRFDVVVANPPFSLDKWGAENAARDRFRRFHRGVPPKGRGDYAFILHMIEAAKPRSGRVAVVAPHGVLFRGGAEGRIRQALVEENLIDTVVGLPAQLFPSTGIPVCLVVFDRSREAGGARAGEDGVLLVDASRDFVPGKRMNSLGPEHLDRIVETVKARAPVERYAVVASRAEIAGNGYNLNIPRYVDTFETEDGIDAAAIQREIVTLEAQLAETRKRMDGFLRELGVDV